MFRPVASVNLLRTAADPTREPARRLSAAVDEAAIDVLVRAVGATRAAIAGHRRSLQSAGAAADRAPGRDGRHPTWPQGLGALADRSVLRAFWRARLVHLRRLLKEIQS